MFPSSPFVVKIYTAPLVKDDFHLPLSKLTKSPESLMTSF
ncbi:hypothetical protein ES332_D05G316700v1 [Gossypium tomentosum]|uniref:Uncharacterized protein n=1 Tax=Gossypium tomentosum TaxID=34277 RepID=A0A5D2L2M4_GOSTO|nr:hypothetical protein ES332_D05G316700v1 [Gossypium tomentosum]